VKVPIGQDEFNVALDGGRAIVRGSCMNMHIQNHDVPFSRVSINIGPAATIWGFTRDWQIPQT
jgi:hypothetical protein